MSNTNRQWRLSGRPSGNDLQSALEFSEVKIESPGDGQVLVRNIYLSLDPTNRIWMSDIDQYTEPVAVGDLMRGFLFGVVEESKDNDFKKDDLVWGTSGWEDYSCLPANTLIHIPELDGFTLLDFVGVLALVGPTAYFGMMDICDPEPGKTIVVSAAAGAVGSIAVQIAKIKGAHVVGIAGSDEKCHWITEELGMDAAINYKTENVEDSLRAHCPDGIDAYFDNVGGEILDSVLAQMNMYGRIAICGLISTYNSLEERNPGPYHFSNILMKRLRVEGFVVRDYFDRYPEALDALAKWMRADKVRYRYDLVDGLENAAHTLEKLYNGQNKGKLMIKVSDEP